MDVNGTAKAVPLLNLDSFRVSLRRNVCRIGSTMVLGLGSAGYPRASEPQNRFSRLV
jgi:hypothetical protein